MTWQKIVPLLAATFLTQTLLAQESSWVERLKLSGDVRVRLDQVHEGKPTVDDIFRGRLRFRLNGDLKLSEYLDGGFQISSGGESPTSTQRSFDNAFLNAMAVIAKAYGVIHAGSELDVYFGKMPLIMYRPGGSDLIYDSDVTPEGLGLTYGLKSDSTSVFFADLGTFFLEDRIDTTTDKRKDNDAGLFTAVLGVRVPVGDWKLSLGAGYNYFAGVKNHPFLVTASAKGNSSTDGVNYANEYQVVQGSLEFKGKIGATPLTVYGDYIQNTDPEKYKNGFLAGFKLNSSKEPGRVAVNYYFRKLEKDATLAVLTDSDFGGGGTDLQGHKLSLESYLDKNLWVGLSQYLVDKKLDDKSKFTMTQLDLVLNF